MIPAAISGPTGRRRENRATPSTVPTSSHDHQMRLGAHQETPRPPSHMKQTPPTAIASSDFQFIKEWISVEGGSVPLAIGAITRDGQNNDPDGQSLFLNPGKEGVQRRDAHDNQHEDGDRHGGVMTR